MNVRGGVFPGTLRPASLFQTVLWDLSTRLSLLPLTLHIKLSLFNVRRVQVYLPTLVFGLIHISHGSSRSFSFSSGAAARSFSPALLRGSVEEKTQGGHEITI